MKIAKVGIDPGHGGAFSRGARGRYGVEEAILNLEIAEKLRDCLIREGFEAEMTRESDVTVGLNNRAKKVQDCDLVLSIHCNANKDPNYRGAWALYWPDDIDRDRLDLSQEILKNLPDELKPTRVYATAPGDWRRGAHWIVEAYKAVCILVECGFVSNDKDLEFLKSPEGQENLADGIVKGLQAWLATKEE